MVALPVDVVVNPAQAVTGARVVRRELDGINRVASGLSQTLRTAFTFAGISVGIQGARQLTGFLANYEQAVSTVAAVTGASVGEVRELEAAFADLGRTTRFSATQAAEGAIALGRAGFETSEILSALPDTLLLAQAGALDLGNAADIASNVLSGFRLEAEETARVADVLAFAANNTNTTVEGLGSGLRFVAPIAASLNISLEETVATMGALGDAGLQAGIAGRGLRGVLGTLAAPSDAAAEALANAGISLEEVDVQARGLPAVLQTLADSGLTAEDAFRIFGDAGASVFEIMRAGVGDIDELILALLDSEGAAEETAAIMDDNLNGALLRVSSAAQGFVLELDAVTNASGVAQTVLDGLAGAINRVTSALGRLGSARTAQARQAQALNETFEGLGLQNFEDVQIFGAEPQFDPNAPLVGVPGLGVFSRAGFAGPEGLFQEGFTGVDEAIERITSGSSGGGGGGGGRSGRSAAAREAERAAEAAAREAEQQRQINDRALERAAIRSQDLEFARQILEAQFQENDRLEAQVRTEERIFRIRLDAARAREGVTDSQALALIQQNEEFAIATEQLRLEEALRDIFREQQEIQREMFEERLDFVNDLTLPSALDDATDATDSLRDSFSGLGSAIRDAFNGGENAMQRFFDNLIDRLLDDALNTLLDNLFSLFGGFGADTSGAFSPLNLLPLGGGGALGGASFGSGILGGATFDFLSGVPILGSGGIATGPTLAMIGETGPEAVIPLDRLGGIGGNPPRQMITLTIRDSNGDRQSTQVPSGADIEIEVDRVMADNISNPRSRTTAALRAGARAGRFS